MEGYAKGMNAGTGVDAMVHEMVQGHPVLVMAVGTTMAELGLVLKSQTTCCSNVVPWYFVCVDSMSYGYVMKRLQQEGWSKEQIEEAIPPSHFFELPTPFAQNFDFDQPLNRSWRHVLFDPALQRIASRPESPGCNGTPAMGRARVEGYIEELSNFFRNHLRGLTHLREETIAIEKGVIAFVVTTYRGGTGTGGALLAAADLKELLPDGQVHLHAVMPDAYGGDQRAFANAFATALENQGYHMYGQKVVTRNGTAFPPPFDTVTYIFGTNGRLALDHKDVLMQEAAILSSYLKAPTQSAILARQVDLTDVIPYDHTDRPLHVRLETAISVSVIHPGVLDYQALKWIFACLRDRIRTFSEYTRKDKLSREDEESLAAFLEKLESDETIPLTVARLLGSIDPSPQPSNVIRSYLEGIGSTIGAMKAATIKEQIQCVVPQVQEAFRKFEAGWKDNAEKMARELPERILSRIRARYEGDGHLILAALKTINERLLAICRELEMRIRSAREERTKASNALNQALKDVQEAGRRLLILGSDEVVRDAAIKAIGIVSNAAHARISQHRMEYLCQALNGEADSTPPIIRAIEGFWTTGELRRIRQGFTQQTKAVNHRLKEVAKSIEKRSPIFQRTLLSEGTDLEALDAAVEEIMKRNPLPGPVEKYLKGEQDLQKTVEELKPLLPVHGDATQSLPGILEAEPKKRELLCQILKSATPCTPLDQVVEDQQGFRNRRDQLRILEIPGGKTTPLAQYLLTEKIVLDENQIVDSGDDEARMYSMRDGLSYGVIQPFLNSYSKAYREHMSKTGSITPHTFEGHHRFPGLEPPSLNLNTYVEQLLYRAMATLPDQVREKPSGGFHFHYEENAGHDFVKYREEEFSNFLDLVRWVSKRPTIYKALEAALKADLDTDPARHKENLFKAWKVAASPREKEHLEDALHALRVNPATFEMASKAEKKQRSSAQKHDLRVLKVKSSPNKPTNQQRSKR